MWEGAIGLIRYVVILLNFYSIPFSDEGTVDATGSGVSLSISLNVGSDSQGHFDLSATDCSFNIDDLSVDFSGGARYNKIMWSRMKTIQVLSNNIQAI